MSEMKINISVLKREDLPDNEPVIVTPGETLSLKMETLKGDISFDILCTPSLDGVAIYGIQDNIHKNKIGILKEVE